MAMDFGQIAKILGKVDTKTLVAVFKFYDSNRDLIDSLLGMLFKLGASKSTNQPKEPPAPIPAGVPVVSPDPPQQRGQIYHTLKAKCFFLEDDRKGGNSGGIIGKNIFDRVLSPHGPDAQMVGQRMHLDITPYDKNGNEIGPGDPRHPGIAGSKRGQAAYTMEYLWTYAGKTNTNSEDEEDRFALESEWDDFGMTPVLLLERGESGRHPVTFKAFIKPEFNGGVRVESNTITWYAD